MRLFSLLLLCLSIAGCTGLKSAPSQTETEAQRLNLSPDQILPNGKVLIDGDTIFESVELERTSEGLLKILDSKDSSVRTSSNVKGGSRHWGSQVAIQFNSDTPDHIRGLIRDACEAWGIACVCRTNQSQYINVEMNAQSICNGGACAEYPNGGVERMHLQSNNDLSTVIHELGHNLGLVHEHQRSDALNYIRNYYPGQGVEGTARGPFDFESIMLYHCGDVPLIDDSLCGLNGMFHARPSRGDLENKMAYSGQTDLSSCVTTPRFNQENFSFRLETTINSRPTSETIYVGPTFEMYVRITNTGQVAWSADERILLTVGASLQGESYYDFAVGRDVQPGEYVDFNETRSLRPELRYEGQAVGTLVGAEMKRGPQLFPQRFTFNGINLIYTTASQAPIPNTKSFAFRFRSTSGQVITSGNVQVYRDQAASTPLVTAAADANGLAMVDLADGRYYIRQTANGYGQDNFYLNVPTEIIYDYGVERWVSPLRPMSSTAPTSGVLTVRVVNASTGSPIAGATVRVGAAQGSTDGNGVVSAPLPFGSYASSVTANGFTAFSTTYNHIAQGTVTVPLNPVVVATPIPTPIPTPPPVTSGTLTICIKYGGAPLPGVTLTSAGPVVGSFVTQANGCVGGAALSFGNYSITATYPGVPARYFSIAHNRTNRVVNYEATTGVLTSN